GLESTVKDCLAKSVGDVSAQQVKAISVDTTGSTPLSIYEKGVLLVFREEFAANPNAMFVLWKYHTAVQKAQQINEHAEKFDINYLQYVGGVYSSEWFWANLLRTLRVDKQVREAMYTWVEHCDYIPFLL